MSEGALKNISFKKILGIFKRVKSPLGGENQQPTFKAGSSIKSFL